MKEKRHAAYKEIGDRSACLKALRKSMIAIEFRIKSVDITKPPIARYMISANGVFSM